MIVRALGGSAANPPDDRDPARVLALLRERELTAFALRDQGVEAPAQAIYALQLACYTIDRVPSQHPNGDRSRRYRLRGAVEETQAGRPVPGGGMR